MDKLRLALKKEILRLSGSPDWVLEHISKMVEEAVVLIEKNPNLSINKASFRVIDDCH